jgi:TRAP-type C4-dicarboxylate transport system substrate-binding protein
MNWISRSFGTAALLAVLGSLLQPAQAQHRRFRLVVVAHAPTNSAVAHGLDRWASAVARWTRGELRVEIQQQWPGVDDQVVRALRAHQIDGAVLTASALRAFTPSVSLLEVPAIVRDDRALERVRGALDQRVRAELERSGLRLAGWNDFGERRIFSRRPIRRPSDLVGAKLWVSPEDPLGAALAASLRASAIVVPPTEVSARLADGSIDTVITSASVVASSGWHLQLTHLTRTTHGSVVAATVFDRERIARLPPDLRNALDEVTATLPGMLERQQRDEDRNQVGALMSLGIGLIDNAQYVDEWNAVGTGVTRQLIGTLFTDDDVALVDRAAR